MTHRIFILGTSHKLQCGAQSCGEDKISLFKEKIRSVLSEYGIARIAEEMSEEGFAESGGDKALGTVCQRVADDVPVQFVDLPQRKGTSWGSRPMTSPAVRSSIRRPQARHWNFATCSPSFAVRFENASGWLVFFPATSGPCFSCAAPDTSLPCKGCSSAFAFRRPSYVLTSTPSLHSRASGGGALVESGAELGRGWVLPPCSGLLWCSPGDRLVPAWAGLGWRDRLATLAALRAAGRAQPVFRGGLAAPSSLAAAGSGPQPVFRLQGGR